MGIVRNLAKSYRDHDCFSLAANISFFAILSLIPLLMITTSVAGYVLGSAHGLFSQIVSAVTDVLPHGQEELAANLDRIISGRTRIGGAGIVALLFISSFLFTSIEHALDIIFQSVKKRNFFHSRLISILLVFGVMFLLFLPTMIRIFQTALARFDIIIPFGYIVTGKAFFAVMMVVSFVLAVMVIPNHDVKFKYAVAGGAFFTAGLGIAKLVFKWYIAQSFDRYNLIYGSLTVLVVTILWIYYISIVLLLSAELVAVLQRRRLCQTSGANGGRAQVF